MPRPLSLDVVMQLDLGQPVGVCRAAPVSLGVGQPEAILLVYSADYDVDPYAEMFFFPTDTLKCALVDHQGKIIWKKDLGRGVVPGMWFCPVLPFDLDGDGADEIWFVNNPDEKHPLSRRKLQLARLDARTGELTGSWQWPYLGGPQPMSHSYRNFLLGGKVQGKPVLVTAQGTYGDMFLQAHDPNMSPRWQIEIPKDAPGPRGAHMHPVVDINDDGDDEFFWGERCLSLDTGRELFCCDRDVYRGHSDIIQPVWDRASKRWLVYTFRESDPKATPRVVMFDATGNRLWGGVDRGHMDMGWVARLREDGSHLASAIRIGKKTSGPDGHVHTGQDEFLFDAITGDRVTLPFSTYETMPIDFNGDGRHELVRGLYHGNGDVLDPAGNIVGNIGGHVSMGFKFLDRPGEQALVVSPEGVARVWADRNAVDTEDALFRYRHRFYQTNRKLSASGFHKNILGGI